MLGNQFVNNLLSEALDGLTDVARIHQLSALLIDDLAFIIGNVIVFQQVFTNIKVVPFDFALGIFDGAIDHLVLNGLTAAIVELVHHVANGLGYEDPHQIVVQRQIETAGSRVTLASGSASELIIDTPRLVAFSANDV